MSGRLSGGCHCGALKVELETACALLPRACQCSFCRRHGARMVSDPEGLAELILGPEAKRYRFGTRTTEFIFCGRCGTYVGALAELDGRVFATLNLNAFDDPRSDLEAAPVDYDGEDAEAKAARRSSRWTPVRLVEGGAT